METLTLLFNLSVVLFVITTMLSMGLGLQVSQIIEPLKSPLLIVDVLVTNFLLVPLAVLLIIFLIPVDEGTKIGLIILSLAAGAPFTPKLVEIVKGEKYFYRKFKKGGITHTEDYCLNCAVALGYYTPEIVPEDKKLITVTLELEMPKKLWEELQVAAKKHKMSVEEFVVSTLWDLDVAGVE